MSFTAALVAVATAWPWFLPLVGAIFGAVFGSFAGCMWHRWPHGFAFNQPPSHCASCGVVLGPAQLVPVLSFLWQRGRCHACRQPIPLSVLVADLAGALLGAMVAALLQIFLLKLPIF